MHIEESVILPLPQQMKALAEAARHFAAQYDCVTHIMVRGSLLGGNNQIYRADSWQTIARLDDDLDLLGIGEPDIDDEHLVWLRPTRSAEVRLAPLEEEN